MGTDRKTSQLTEKLTLLDEDFVMIVDSEATPGSSEANKKAKRSLFKSGTEIPTYNLTHDTGSIYNTTVPGVASRDDLPNMYYVVFDDTSNFVPGVDVNFLMLINGSLGEAIFFYTNTAQVLSNSFAPGIPMLVNKRDSISNFDNLWDYDLTKKSTSSLTDTSTIGDNVGYSLIFNYEYQYTGVADATITLAEDIGLLQGQSTRIRNTTSNTVTLEGAVSVNSITGDLILEENDLVEIMCLSRSASNTGGDYVVTRLNSRPIEAGGEEVIYLATNIIGESEYLADKHFVYSLLADTITISETKGLLVNQSMIISSNGINIYAKIVCPTAYGIQGDVILKGPDDIIKITCLVRVGEEEGGLYLATRLNEKLLSFSNDTAAKTISTNSNMQWFEHTSATSRDYTINKGIFNKVGEVCYFKTTDVGVITFIEGTDVTINPIQPGWDKECPGLSTVAFICKSIVGSAIIIDMV